MTVAHPLRSLKRAGATTEIVLALILSGVLVHLVPFRWTVRLLGTVASPREQHASGFDSQTVHRARAVAWRTHLVASRLPWASRCLAQAIAGAVLLRRRGIIGATIRIGVRKRNDVLEAHAWLMLGGTTVLGGAGADTYRPVADLSGRLY